jgi:hypothetical protein
MRSVLSSEIKHMGIVGLVAGGLAHISSHEINLPVSHETRHNKLSQEQMTAVFRKLIKSMKKKRQDYFIRGLHKLVRIITEYDENYRKEHGEGDWFIASDAVMLAAKMAVKNDIRIYKEFEPFTKWIEDEEGARRYRINVSQGGGRQRYEPVLSLLDVIERRKYFGRYSVDEAVVFAEEHGLGDDIRRGLVEAAANGLRAAANCRQKKLSLPFRRYMQDADSMYLLFAKLRYAFRVFPYLYPDIWERAGGEPPPPEDILST